MLNQPNRNNTGVPQVKRQRYPDFQNPQQSQQQTFSLKDKNFCLSEDARARGTATQTRHQSHLLNMNEDLDRQD